MLKTHNSVKSHQECTQCHDVVETRKLISACTDCGGRMEHIFEGSWDGIPENRNDQWKNFDVMPLVQRENIVSLGEGDSELIELEELNEAVGGARLFIKLDATKNPTGVFKDREASLILSRCKEAGLDNLVFYSTGNTGRSYTHYAAQLGLTTYFFMPKQCAYKHTDSMQRNPNNFTIFVDDNYPTIGPYAKQFAKTNELNTIAPLHDRTEAYTTFAYEQFQQMPQCDFFVQTIASGMGAIGFHRGHKNLVKFGLEEEKDVPRIVCVQSSELNSMYRAYTEGKESMIPSDLPAKFPSDLFEPTLNSTNPVNNYPDLYETLNDSNGVITDASPEEVKGERKWMIDALEKRGIHIRTDLEQSILIGYTGLVKLAAEGVINKGDRIFLVGTGRGNDMSKKLILPDATINPAIHDPEDLKRRLDEIVIKS